jgi:hypothetical protein
LALLGPQRRDDRLESAKRANADIDQIAAANCDFMGTRPKLSPPLTVFSTGRANGRLAAFGRGGNDRTQFIRLDPQSPLDDQRHAGRRVADRRVDGLTERSM